MSNVNVKKHYAKRTLRYLKNAFVNICNDYMRESRENLKDKRNLDIPTQKKMSEVYDNFMKYNAKQKGFIRLTMDEMKTLWNTAKKEVSYQAKRMGTDPTKLQKKEKAEDNFDYDNIPDFDDVETNEGDGLESVFDNSFLGFETEGVYNTPNSLFLSQSFLNKVLLLFTTMVQHENMNLWASTGNNTDVKIVDIVTASVNSTPMETKCANKNSEILTALISRVKAATSVTYMDPNPLVKPGTENAVDVIITKDTTELKSYVTSLVESLSKDDYNNIMIISNILNDIVETYNSLYPSDKVNLINNIPLLKDLSDIYSQDMALDIFILFYFEIIDMSKLVECQNKIREFINN